MAKKPANFPTPTAPRSLEDLQKAYLQAKNKLADAQYLVYVYGLEVNTASEEMREINQEAAERSKLDAEIKKELEAKNG